MQSLALCDASADGPLNQAVMLWRPIRQTCAIPIRAATIRGIPKMLCWPSAGCEGRVPLGIALAEFDALDEALDRCEENSVEHKRR